MVQTHLIIFHNDNKKAYNFIKLIFIISYYTYMYTCKGKIVWLVYNNN